MIHQLDPAVSASQARVPRACNVCTNAPGESGCCSTHSASSCFLALNTHCHLWRSYKYAQTRDYRVTYPDFPATTSRKFIAMGVQDGTLDRVPADTTMTAPLAEEVFRNASRKRETLALPAIGQSALSSNRLKIASTTFVETRFGDHPDKAWSW